MGGLNKLKLGLALGSIILSTSIGFYTQPAFDTAQPEYSTMISQRFDFHTTNEEVEAEIETIVNNHPDIAHKLVIGQSVQGRNIYAIRISDDDTPGDEPPVLFLASYHSDEIATKEIALELANYLTEMYDKDPNVTYLVNNREIYIVPVVNPDGIMTETGRPSRCNANNVDLNRNHSAMGWIDEDPIGICTSSGEYPGSEPETVAVENLIRKIFSDFREPIDEGQSIGNTEDRTSMDTQGVIISLHSFWRGGAWLMAWGYNLEYTPDHEDYSRIIERLAELSHYYVSLPDDYANYEAPGVLEDYAYGNYGIPAFTIELSGFSKASDYDYVGLNWDYVKESLLYAITISEIPYVQSYAYLLDRVYSKEDYVNLMFEEYEYIEFYIDVGPENGGVPVFVSRTGVIEADDLDIPPGRHVLIARGFDGENYTPCYGVAFVER